MGVYSLLVRQLQLCSMLLIRYSYTAIVCEHLAAGAGGGAGGAHAAARQRGIHPGLCGTHYGLPRRNRRAWVSQLLCCSGKLLLTSSRLVAVFAFKLK